ncbi:MAG: hypothetical protein C4523_04265 [Myxococcales bacterium]|nr:MAG: hypothetical protein C4523_04265 [Myxococcales bacterium]
MRFTALPRSCAPTGLIILFSIVTAALWADEPKYRNPNPAFKLLPPEEEARLAPIKLGKPPAFSSDELKKIQAGDVVVRKLAETGDRRRYEAIGKVDLPPKAVMAFMRDYSLRVGVMPHNEKVHAEWQGNMAVVDMTLKVGLSRVSYRQNILHYLDSYMEWEYVHGDLKHTAGYYKFFPYSEGRKTLVVYNVETDPGLPLPGFLLDLLTKSSMPDVIRAIRKGAALKQGQANSN